MGDNRHVILAVGCASDFPNLLLTIPEARRQGVVVFAADEAIGMKVGGSFIVVREQGIFRSLARTNRFVVDPDVKEIWRAAWERTREQIVTVAVVVCGNREQALTLAKALVAGRMAVEERGFLRLVPPATPRHGPGIPM